MGKRKTNESLNQADLLLPVNREVERAILGSVLLDNSCWEQAAMALQVEDFSLDSHRRIYRALLELDCERQPFDYVTLSEELRRTSQLEVIGGDAYMMSLTDGLPRVKNIDHYVRIVTDYSRRRRMIEACNRGMYRVADTSEKMESAVADVQQELNAIASASEKVRACRVSEYSEEMFSRLREQARSPKTEELLGLSFGYAELDVATGGAMPGESVVIAGYSGDGKSLTASQMSYANVSKGIPGLVFTQEMTKEQYLRRMIPQATNGFFPAYLLRDPRGVSEELIAELDRAETVLSKFPLWTVDASRIDITQLIAISRSLIRREKIKFVICDFIQLVDASGYERGYDRVTAVSAALRELAKEEGIVSVAISQLTPADKGKKSPPNMFMLRSSGDIAQNAHIIVFAYRPESQSGKLTDKDQLRLAKMREGAGRIPFPVELCRNTLTWIPRTVEKKSEDDDSLFEQEAKKGKSK